MQINLSFYLCVSLRDRITEAETSDDDTVFFIIMKVQHIIVVKKKTAQ